MVQTSQDIRPPNFLDSYVAPAGVYDELLDGQGNLRPAWHRFHHILARLSTAEFARRWDQSQNLLHENGIAFGAYGDSEGAARPWVLDPLPLVIAAESWQQVAAGLAQRARLLDRVLADLYGPQTLLSRRILPAEMVFRHPGFLRAYHGQRPAGNRFVPCYAADLARAPDGNWWVLADRTEAPSGVGFALENRIVVSRMLPDVFHGCQVERLATYFLALQQMLAQSAPQHRDNPRIVLLSQGPESPNFFEDAYMARYLGYTLVEGGDLAVRNGQVMLKTLGGLLPVDVVFRRPNSEFCDPLELAADASGGIVGLLQAARERTVAITNVLGAGLVESPVFMAFLPVCCQELLREDLLLPNLATWWCADPDSKRYVLDHLDGLVIRRAFRVRGQDLPFHRMLQAWPIDRLAAAIESRPHDFVAQERIDRSTAPVWSNGGIQPARIALRSYVVASGDGFEVMRGGLVRVSQSPRPLDFSILSGEGSKDAWIVSDQPVSQVSLLQMQAQTVELRRSGAELPSRVADNLYWLGRQIERSEAAARLLRTTILRLTSETECELLPELPMLLRALVEQGQIEPGYVVEGINVPLPALGQTLPGTVLDEHQAGSLRFTVTQLFRVATLVRDRISTDSWRILSRIDQQFRPWPRYAGVDLTDLLTILDQMIIDLAAFSGMVMESMTRSHIWRFLDLGRRLERALQVICLARSALEHAAELSGPVLETLLEVADSLMTYRGRYLANLQLGAVIDLLLTDDTNPRSLAYQLVLLADHVDRLPRNRTQPLLGLDQRLAMSLLHDIRMVDVPMLADLHARGQSAPLVELLTALEERLPKLSDAVNHQYLIHAGTAHQLTKIRLEAPA
jgi:uncharacterized circularly permuted ATP-grasp superfamily protein/uncharacterized alpha-E superfamily protein